MQNEAGLPWPIAGARSGISGSDKPDERLSRRPCFTFLNPSPTAACQSARLPYAALPARAAGDDPVDILLYVAQAGLQSSPFETRAESPLAQANYRLWIEHAHAENRRELERLVATLHEDCEYEVVPLGRRWHGKDEVREFYRGLWRAIPNVKLTLLNRVDADANLTDAPTAFAGDAVLKVQPPTSDEVGRLREGSVLISFLQPAINADVIGALAKRKVSAFSLDLVPRISRAQSMDALSSQAGIAGYKAVLLGANHLAKFFPLLMTAAGTVAPARVLVMGAGVAGLQAIATARRLGAVVEAYDVRPAVKDEVKSLGATF